MLIVVFYGIIRDIVQAANTSNLYIIKLWTSLPSRQGVVEALEEQKNVIELEENQVYINQWCIQLQK